VDTFTLIVIVGLVVLVGGLLALGLWHPSRAMDITDRDRQREWATQAEVEETDIPQMVDAQNAYRAERGEEALTERDFQERANASQRESIARAKGDRSADPEEDA
jgi:hypothetical protein